MCIHLHVNEPDEVLIIKFYSSLLLPLRWEVDLFYNASPDKDNFLRALDIEIKVTPHIKYASYRIQDDKPPPSHSQPYPSSLLATNNAVWCNFYKINSHNYVDC
jgi:hypothetical protein